MATAENQMSEETPDKRRREICDERIVKAIKHLQAAIAVLLEQPTRSKLSYALEHIRAAQDFINAMPGITH
jgi:hypothetical protein